MILWRIYARVFRTFFFFPRHLVSCHRFLRVSQRGGQMFPAHPPHIWSRRRLDSLVVMSASRGICSVVIRRSRCKKRQMREPWFCWEAGLSSPLFSFTSPLLAQVFHLSLAARLWAPILFMNSILFFWLMQNTCFASYATYSPHAFSSRHSPHLQFSRANLQADCRLHRSLFMFIPLSSHYTEVCFQAR